MNIFEYSFKQNSTVWYKSYMIYSLNQYWNIILVRSDWRTNCVNLVITCALMHPVLLNSPTLALLSIHLYLHERKKNHIGIIRVQKLVKCFIVKGFKIWISVNVNIGYLDSVRIHCQMLSIVYIFILWFNEYIWIQFQAKFNCLVQKLHDQKVKNVLNYYFDC